MNGPGEGAMRLSLLIELFPHARARHRSHASTSLATQPTALAESCRLAGNCPALSMRQMVDLLRRVSLRTSKNLRMRSSSMETPAGKFCSETLVSSAALPTGHRRGCGEFVTKAILDDQGTASEAEREKTDRL